MAGFRRWMPKRTKSGFRSKTEEKFAGHLDELGVPYSYEKHTVKYKQKDASYKVDFDLGKFIIEYKGQFTSEDRTKHLLIKSQHPSLDIRFVFDRASNYLNKNSDTTYSDWCDQYGFKWAEKIIPPEWLKELE
jgi:hypothetical protein